MAAAEPVEKSKKLLKLTVSLGGDVTRTIFAGIKTAYDPATLVGRLIVVCINLAPREIKGVGSAKEWSWERERGTRKCSSSARMQERSRGTDCIEECFELVRVWRFASFGGRARQAPRVAALPANGMHSARLCLRVSGSSSSPQFPYGHEAPRSNIRSPSPPHCVMKP